MNVGSKLIIMQISTEVVILGTGIAGLSLAKYLSESNPKTSILLLSKTTLDEWNMNYALSGIAVVHYFIENSYEQFISVPFQPEKDCVMKK